MPAASWIGFSATISCIVEQFGFAIRPLWPSSASGLTSATTSGTSGSRRHLELLSTTTAPASTKRGAHSPDVDAAGGEDREVEALDRVVVERADRSRRRARLPAERSRRERDDRGRREAALAQLRAHHGADGAGGADDGDAVPAHSDAPCGPNGCSASIWSAPSSNASCSARTARSTTSAVDDARDLDRRRRDHLDVDALVAERGEHARGDARVRLHPGADDRDLAHLGVLGDLADADVGHDRVQRRARDAQVRARDGEAHVGRRALVRLVLDDHVDVDVGVGERGEDAPGDARVVRDAEQRQAGLVARMRDGGDQGAFHRLLFSDHEGSGRLRERGPAVDSNSVVARVFDAAQLQHAGAGRRHLEHLLEARPRAACGRPARSADRR